MDSKSDFFNIVAKNDFPIFADVKRASVIWPQVIAFLLLAVFTTIQSAKVMHTHAATVTTHVSFDGDTVDKTGDCSICDYQLSKNAALPTIYFDIQKPECYPVSFPLYQYSAITSIGLHFSDRGPPALA